MQRTMSFLAGVICGAVVGSVAALLLTPMPGSELQAQARGQFDSMLSEARRAAQERQTVLRERLQDLRAPQPGAIEIDSNE